MWTLISRINTRRARGRVSRVVLTTAIVIATATEVAMGLLPKPAAATAGAVLVELDPAVVGAVEMAPAEELPALASAGRALVAL